MAFEIHELKDLQHEVVDILSVSDEGVDFRLVGRDAARYRLKAEGGKLAVEQLSSPAEPTLRASALSEEPVPETAAEAAASE